MKNKDFTVSIKKQIILPITILAISGLLFGVFANMKTPPEEKAEVDNTPIVAVENITVDAMALKVDSYGVVKPKYQTQLVAQVSGQIVELSAVFVRGGFVKQGQLLARIDPNDYEAALIDAQANLASARASLEKERAQGKVAEREWQKITHSAPTQLSLRKPQLAQELARVKAAQASVLRAERNMERTEVKAPYDAMIAERNIGLGSVVGTGTAIGKLYSTDIAEVRLPVADNQLKFLVDQGDSAKVNLFGSFAGEAQIWQAEINRSEGVVDDKSRMTYLVAEIKDPYRLSANKDEKPLRFGSYVKAKIVGVELLQASVLPSYLVVNGKVALLDEDSTLHYVKVNVVRQQGDQVIVDQGVVDGDQLIVSALDYPIEGMKLSLSTSDLDDSDRVADRENQIANVKE
jgi:RND family efflux transporter MFP subunit